MPEYKSPNYTIITLLKHEKDRSRWVTSISVSIELIQNKIAPNPDNLRILLNNKVDCWFRWETCLNRLAKKQLATLIPTKWKFIDNLPDSHIIIPTYPLCYQREQQSSRLMGGISLQVPTIHSKSRGLTAEQRRWNFILMYRVIYLGEDW